MKWFVAVFASCIPLILMRFKRLQWLFPVAVSLHNGEEAIWVPGWDLRHAAKLPVHPPGASEIRFVLIVLTAAALAITYLSNRKGPQSFWAYLLFGYVVAMLANVFVPHLPAALFFHSYAPGVITAALINLPLMSYLAVLEVRDKWVSGWKAVGFGVGVPAATGGIIVAIFSL